MSLTAISNLSRSLSKSCVMDPFQTCVIILQVLGQIFNHCVLQSTVISERIPLDQTTCKTEALHELKLEIYL